MVMIERARYECYWKGKAQTDLPVRQGGEPSCKWED